MCQTGKLEASIEKRGAVRARTARRSHQSLSGQLLKCVRKRRKLASACSHAVDSEAPHDSWMWNVPKIPALAAQPHGLGRFLYFWISMRKADVVSGCECGQQRSAPKCSQMCWNRGTLQCFRTKISIQRLPHHTQSFVLHVTTPAVTVYLSRWPWFSP